jgi:hypothetical protein
VLPLDARDALAEFFAGILVEAGRGAPFASMGPSTSR